MMPDNSLSAANALWSAIGSSSTVRLATVLLILSVLAMVGGSSSVVTWATTSTLSAWREIARSARQPPALPGR
jgi:hypothetical protein